MRIIKSVLENKYLGYCPAKRDQSHWPGFHGTLAVCSDPGQHDLHYYMKTEHLLNIGFFKSNKYFIRSSINHRAGRFARIRGENLGLRLLVT